MKWIKVEDRLPEKYAEVLVYGVNYFDTPIQCYLANSNKWYASREVRDSMIEGYCENPEILSFDKITHWMPLPSPPNN